MTGTPTGPTIDDPATTQVTAEYYYVETEGSIPGLVITLYLPDGPPGTDWVFDSVVDTDPGMGTITVLCYPNGDDEGYERLDDVGEW